MKLKFFKPLILIVVSALFLWGLGPAHATLIDNSGIVHDDVNSSYWYSDLPGTSSTYAGLLTFISGLNASSYGGYNSWHLATESEITDLFSYDEEEIHDVFNHTSAWLGSQTHTYTYRGRYDDGGGANAFNGQGLVSLQFKAVDQSLVSKEQSILPDKLHPDRDFSAWITTGFIDTEPPPVPEPSTILLFGLGMLGLANISRRKRMR